MKTLTIHVDESGRTVSRHVFGHFSEHLGRCIYDGYWPGEKADSSISTLRGIRTDIVEALRAISAPNIRWPGGCFADDYHWRDGIGPKDDRPSMINTHWGGVIENNHFGTHEFLDLCEQVGAEPYICGNVGSGSVREMRDWVEYIAGSSESPMGRLRTEHGHRDAWPLTYFGVGNENWGCGGNMRPEYYADLYRQFSGYVRKVGGPGIYRIACGAHDELYDWTEVLMREAADQFEGLSYHYYTGLPKRDGVSRSSTEYGDYEWFLTMHRAIGLEAALERHMSIMDAYDPERRVGLIVDEWGTWHDVEPGTNPGFLYQQNTIRDALVAAHHLNLFGAKSNRIHMTNIAQTINVLQAVLLTDGAHLIKTPTYHVFDMYQGHHDGVLVRTNIDRGEYDYEGTALPALSSLCTRGEDGSLHLTIANVDPNQSHEIAVELRGGRPELVRETVPDTQTGDLKITGRILVSESMQAHNTVEEPVKVAPKKFDDFRVDGESQSLRLTVPERSVIEIEITNYSR